MKQKVNNLPKGKDAKPTPEKCLFGVDRPFGDSQLSKDAILRVAKTQAIANAVLGQNIANLLSIEK